ncbi:acyl-CoA--6-aminopenicillanic acid acyl-transferase [Pseudomonas brassicacearum]|uniref:C45 family autoproteolytic acyltransferase/hydolase n=1 Tax=Pseudomonas brassicacearum TaxID=930166 RepID=UPI000F4A7AA3|nr:C45 family peptidase [Pseudomonas brassicacearum]ROM83096.1 acyl-CoA--6-aminopenicillanic acid acyl-transferase [Pseudomonas brassicacearum]
MTLSPIHLAGDAHAIGHGLGVFGRDAVLRHLRPLPLWQHLTSLSQTQKAVQMRQAVQTEFPRYWQEIEGLAAGLQLPLDEVFMWNCRGDYVHQQSVDGCTTLFGPASDGVLIAHNEDGFPQLRGQCALLHAQPDSGLAFSSFVYPGSLPGHTLAVNECGLVATVNNIRPTRIPAGIPRQILGRATLDARTLDEAIAVVTRIDRAGAFHHTFGQAGSRRVVSVEACAEGSNVSEVQRPGGHSNHLIAPSLSRLQQRITASSGARQQCIDQCLRQLPGELDEEVSLSILRDTSGGHLPVYRAAADDPDDENTLATGVFMISANTVEWRIYTKPNTDQPDIEGVVLLSR